MVVRKELAGNRIMVDTGCLVGFTSGINYDIAQAGNLRSMLFGGEGLFFATLRGPGKVWLQTMPMSKLASKVAQFMPQVGGKGSSGGLNINVGDLLGG